MEFSEPVKVGVNLFYNPSQKTCEPTHVKWKNEVFKVSKIGFHHTNKIGNIIYHIFSVSVNPGDFFMRLVFDTHHLTWVLEECYDPKLN